MKLRPQSELRGRREKASEALAPAEVIIEPEFDLAKELTPEDQRFFRSQLSIDWNLETKLEAAFEYALAFPQDRQAAKKSIERGFPLTKDGKFSLQQSPVLWLIMFTEKTPTLLAKLGSPAKIIERALKEKRPNYLIVASLFLKEYQQHLEALRDKWRQVSGTTHVPHLLWDLSWLKICDPKLYSTMPSTPEAIEEGIKNFRFSLDGDRRYPEGPPFYSLKEAFALHVLTGGDALFAGDHIVVRPRTKMRKDSPLPDRPRV